MNMSSTSAPPIGRLQVKLAYRRNLLKGILLASSAAICLSGILGFTADGSATSDPEVPPGGRPGGDTVFITPPPPDIFEIPKRAADPPHVKSDGVDKADFGKVIAAEDREASEFGSLDDLRKFAAGKASAGSGGIDGTEIILPDNLSDLPPPGIFIAYEEAPVNISEDLPAYPAMALRAGIEGSVWVEVLIGKDGRVLDALILRESGQNAGFEESAISSARKSIWKPAISGGQPVAVWISYKVVFRLK